MPQMIKRIFISRLFIKKQIEQKIIIHIMVIDNILIPLGMELVSWNDLRYLPNNFWLINQECRRWELFRKHPEASSKKGVVGNPGTRMPINPRATSRTPKKIYMSFIIFFKYCILS
jgi:hypothetical protein